MLNHYCDKGGVQNNQKMLKTSSKYGSRRDEELIAKSGVEGATFVHAAGFIGGNKTREGALRMAAKTIELNAQQLKA